MDAQHVIEAWDQAGPDHTHPTRGISEEAYWQSGRTQAAILAKDLPPGARVVDFGSGDGRVAVALRALGFEVTAVDSSPRMLAALSEVDPDMPTVLSDGTGLYRRLRRKADAAVAISVLIHHDYATARRIIGELRDATRRGGLLFLDWPTSADPAEGQVWTDVTTWHPDAQAAVAEELGLRRVEVDRPWAVYRVVRKS